MTKISPTALLLTVLALESLPQTEERVITTNHKEIIKRDKTPKAKKPGRGKPAKGYNPVTKTWEGN